MFLDIRTEKAIEKAVTLEEIEAIKQRVLTNFAVEFDEHVEHAKFFIERFYSRHKDKPLEHLTKNVSAMMDEMNLARDAERRGYWRGLLLEKLKLEQEYTLLVRKQLNEKLKEPFSEYVNDLQLLIRTHEAIADIEVTFLAQISQVKEILENINQKKQKLGLPISKIAGFGKQKYMPYREALGGIKKALHDFFNLPLDRAVTPSEGYVSFYLNPMLHLQHMDRPRRLDLYIKNLDENSINEVTSYVKMQIVELRK